MYRLRRIHLVEFTESVILMNKVLVTGGCGFVGRHLIQRLLVENYEVHCVDVIAPLSGAVEPND